LPRPSPSPGDARSRLSSAAIVGITLGSVAISIIIALVVLFAWNRVRSKRRRDVGLLSAKDSLYADPNDLYDEIERPRGAVPRRQDRAVMTDSRVDQDHFML
jgi:hypothetical protein